MYAGAGLALTTGLLVGAAMRPQLIFGEGPGGPQIIAGVSGVRAAPRVEDGLAYAAYANRVPDYVVGTDWRKAQTAQTAAAPLPDYGQAESYYVSPITDEFEAPARPITQAANDHAATAAERVSYPSLDGAAAYEDGSRAEKTPVAELADPATDRPADIDPEARPEATGDTTVER